MGDVAGIKCVLGRMVDVEDIEDTAEPCGAHATVWMTPGSMTQRLGEEKNFMIDKRAMKSRQTAALAFYMVSIFAPFPATSERTRRRILKAEREQTRFAAG